MPEEKEDIVVLIDEYGQEEEFEFIDSIELEGVEYEVFCPLTEDEDDCFEDEVEMVILKVEISEDGEKTYVTIEDEEELDAVFEEFKIKMEDEFIFDFEDGDFMDDYDDEDYDEEDYDENYDEDYYDDEDYDEE